MSDKVRVQCVPDPNEPTIKGRFLKNTTQMARTILHISVFIQTIITCVLGAKEPMVKQKWRESTDRSDDNVAVIDCFTGRECRPWVEKQI